MVDVLGYEGSYSIEWEGQITDNGITAITTGDSDNDNETEIIVGGFDFNIYILGYNGAEYIEETNQSMGTMIFTLGVGDTDGDGSNELITEIGYFDLKVFEWNGVSYLQEWNMTLNEDAVNEAMDINFIDANGKDHIVLGVFELFVIGYDLDYTLLFKSETYTFVIQCLFMGDLDETGSNEVLISTGSYVFVFGKDLWAYASLFASKTTALTSEEISFDGSQSKGAGTLMYYFDFGDGGNSGWISTSTVSHSYNSPGSYTASLKVRDASGNESTNSAKISITVLEPNIIPVAHIDGITPNPATKGVSVTFSGSGTDSDGTIVSYLWQSSIDGFLSDKNTFSTSQLSEGNHTISFSVLDDRDSWSDIVERDLKIEPEIHNIKPSAFIDSISPPSGSQGDTITFTGHGTDEDGTIISYLWESNLNSMLSDQSSFSTSTLSIGTHIISFTVQDDGELWSEPINQTLTIEAVLPNKAPTAIIETISHESAYEGETISFVGLGEDDDGIIVSYLWESSLDGEISTQRSFSTSSLSIGEHTIALTVTDDKNTDSEPVKTTVLIKEKETKETNLTNPVMMGIILLIGILLLATFLVVSVKKKSRNEGQMVGCPFCGSTYMITFNERPIAVQCPSCNQTSMIYE
jgi:PKD repeat protein